LQIIIEFEFQSWSSSKSCTVPTKESTNSR